MTLVFISGRRTAAAALTPFVAYEEMVSQSQPVSVFAAK